MPVEVFAITRRPQTPAVSSVSQSERSELVTFLNIQHTIQFGLISLPNTLKSITDSISNVLEGDDTAPKSKITEFKRLFQTIDTHINELHSLRFNSRKLLKNLDEARMDFLLNYNASLKWEDPNAYPQNITPFYTRELAIAKSSIAESQSAITGFAHDFERHHQVYVNALSKQYQDVMLSFTNLSKERVQARLKQMSSYVAAEGAWNQIGKFLHNDFVNTPRQNIVAELKKALFELEILDAELKTIVFSNIPGLSQQILILHGIIHNGVTALETIPNEFLHSAEKMRVLVLQDNWKKLFNEDFLRLYSQEIDSMVPPDPAISEPQRRVEAGLRSTQSPDLDLDPLFIKRKAEWKTALQKMTADCTQLSTRKTDLRLSQEIQKVRTALQSGSYRGTFPDLVRFFLDRTIICEDVSLAERRAQFFNLYLWPKELLPLLSAIKNHINRTIGILIELIALLRSVTPFEARQASAWSDFLLSATEKKAITNQREKCSSIKNKIIDTCYETIDCINAQLESDVLFNSDSDYNSRCHLFVLATPPTDYSKDFLGRQKVVIGINNHIPTDTLILLLKYYNYLAKHHHTTIKLTVVPLNSQDLYKYTGADFNRMFGHVFAAATAPIEKDGASRLIEVPVINETYFKSEINHVVASATEPLREADFLRLTQIIFEIDEVYLIGGCIRKVNGNYTLILLESYHTGTIPKILYTHISNICASYGITFDSYANVPQFTPNSGFAAIEAIAYLSRSDFRQPTLMTDDNNDGFTADKLRIHMHRLQGKHIVQATVPPAPPSHLTLGEALQRMTSYTPNLDAATIADRLYYYCLRNRWARLIQIALRDPVYKTQTEAGRVFQVTTASVTVMPRIDNLELTQMVDRLNLFPLVPPMHIEKITQEHRMKFDALKRNLDYNMRALECETTLAEIHLKKTKEGMWKSIETAHQAAMAEVAERFELARATPQVLATVSPHRPPSALAASIAAAIATPQTPASARPSAPPAIPRASTPAFTRASAPAAPAAPAPHGPASWFRPRSSTMDCSRCSGRRAPSAPPCSACGK